jgi:cell division septum initiation protein DivIVA
VEQVFQLAEQQADDCREAARQDAERIVAEAWAEAESILNEARTGSRGPDPPPRG